MAWTQQYSEEHQATILTSPNSNRIHLVANQTGQKYLPLTRPAYSVMDRPGKTSALLTRHQQDRILKNLCRLVRFEVQNLIPEKAWALCMVVSTPRGEKSIHLSSEGSEHSPCKAVPEALPAMLLAAQQLVALNTPEGTRRPLEGFRELQDTLRGTLWECPQSPSRFCLGTSADSRLLSEAYTLDQWQLLVQLPGFERDWASGQFDQVEECLDQLGVAFILTTEDQLEVLFKAGRGTRFLVMLRPREEPHDWFMDLVHLGQGRYHGFLYGEHDPEERQFESPQEVLECFRQAQVLEDAHALLAECPA